MIVPLHLAIAKALLTEGTGCAKNFPHGEEAKIFMLERQNAVAVCGWHINYIGNYIPKYLFSVLNL